MTAIAMFYIVDGIAGPIVTGAAIGAMGEQGVVASVGTAGLLFVIALALYPGSSHRQ